MAATEQDRHPASLRVLHLGKFMPPHPGGIERFLAELMPALDGHGVGNAALVHAEPGASGTRRVRRQARALVVRAAVATTTAFTPVSPRWPVLLRRLIERWQPQLLHLHLPNPSAFWALALPAARRLPWVVHWHADVPVDALDRRLRLLYRAYRPMETAVLKRAAAVIPTTHSYAEASVPLRPWAAKLHCLPLGLPEQSKARPDPALWPSGDGLRLLFVGRFSYYKGLEHLVTAMTRLPASCRLLLIGDGERRQAIEGLIDRLGLHERVRCAGTLDDEALAGAYAAADVLCLPSIERSEAFGLVLLEAMRAGVTSVATRIPGTGMAEVLGDGQAGLLVEPGAAHELAAAILRLQEQPALRAQLAAQAHERFLRCYRIDVVAGNIAALYRQVLAAATRHEDQR